MFEYFKKSLARKKARRQFQEYPHIVNVFPLEKEGEVSFANWQNPLVSPKTITQAEVNFYRKFISEGSLCIDIGTNIGDTTVPMALAAGKTGTTIGFDPNPHVFKILQINASLNPDKTNIVPLPYAITKEEGEFSYSSSEASFGNGGISNEVVEDQGAFQLPEKIKGINLEQYLKANYTSALSRLAFIKVDVEGADMEVIRSISELIRKYKPVLVAECFPKATPEERAELYHMVTELGYKLYYFSDFDENAKISHLAGPRDMNKWKTFNFYAVPEEA
ncbi:FkbM family methyltransferase [Dyadobacter sandarakinus]|uniref:FkbM family methyltransferase n=1 Tax=Dyadobacter sandarakinus TaxID=2747268 RepID=A0ABX7IC84_9BACT|nr:FkbM family methyltransferase [Dyadobacter sandarakinus]QRR03328.1 FkbM family methyltransferase [Dyadobacter sandarakinus]